MNQPNTSDEQSNTPNQQSNTPNQQLNTPSDQSNPPGQQSNSQPSQHSNASVNGEKPESFSEYIAASNEEKDDWKNILTPDA